MVVSGLDRLVPRSEQGRGARGRRGVRSAIRELRHAKRSALRFNAEINAVVGLQGALRGTAEFETSASEAIRWPS